MRIKPTCSCAPCGGRRRTVNDPVLSADGSVDIGAAAQDAAGDTDAGKDIEHVAETAAAGAAAGAAIGGSALGAAAAGAALGSALPGVGTAIGAAVGALYGLSQLTGGCNGDPDFCACVDQLGGTFAVAGRPDDLVHCIAARKGGAPVGHQATDDEYAAYAAQVKATEDAAAALATQHALLASLNDAAVRGTISGISKKRTGDALLATLAGNPLLGRLHPLGAPPPSPVRTVRATLPAHAGKTAAVVGVGVGAALLAGLWAALA